MWWAVAKTRDIVCFDEIDVSDYNIRLEMTTPQFLRDHEVIGAFDQSVDSDEGGSSLKPPRSATKSFTLLRSSFGDSLLEDYSPS